jgi:predicted DNA-binding protein (UPF0251 family)
MGRDTIRQTTPDLFSTEEVRELSEPPTKANSGNAAGASTPSKRYVLPENLDLAVKQLTDDELIELLEVALKEAKQRGKSPLRIGGDPVQSSRQTKDVTQKHPNIEDASSRKRTDEVKLSPGKLNAVRAAFKAGVTPSRIARQFGISQLNVRKALASDDRTS